MEDVPGVGKTTLAKALARCFSGDFRRVQFTPDLLPADILGSAVYNPRDGGFTFKEGPIFAKVLLADEINRASPRTQSALLEAMSEQQVSSDGVTRPLPSPFMVLATQNPVEFHGTYPLPEAQLDRFGVRIELGYPAAEREVEVLFAQAERHPLDTVEPVLSGDDVIALQAEVRHVRVDRSLGRYVVALAEATRRHPSVRLGCSPRGSLMLFRSTQARAIARGPLVRRARGREDAGRARPRAPPRPRDEGTLHRRLQGGRRARDPRGRARAGLTRQAPERTDMATNLLTRPLDRSYLLSALRAFYHRRLTERGRFVVWATVGVALVGMDTRRSLVFMLFALAAPPLLVAFGRFFAGRPAVRLDGRLPSRLTAGRLGGGVPRTSSRATAAPRGLSPSCGPGRFPTRPCSPWSPPSAPSRWRETAPPASGSTSTRGGAGRYVLPSVGIARTDLFGLVRTKAVWLPEQVVLAYPRYHTLDELPLPMGRRYQPGGIPLASVVGDSLEFVGTREYREGDPLRKIDWRSWARLGRPVVKEFQEEYFSRIALVLDTFLGKQAAARASASASRRRSRRLPPWPSTSAGARRSSTSSPPARTSTR